VSDQMTEATTDQDPVVLEDTEEDQERMHELEQRIIEQGGITPTAPDDATRGGFGSPQSMITEAKKHVGYRETGENDTKFNRWLGAIGGYPHEGFGYPWCHAFVSYCLWHSDNADTGPRTAGCESGVGWFKQHGRYDSTPHVGDIVYYGPGGGTHVELVVGVTPDTIQTIGGNTSGSVDGKTFFNGNGVYQKTVKRSSRINGYGHPEYSSGQAAAGPAGPTAPAAAKTVKPMTNVRSIKAQQEAVNALGHMPKLDMDGQWGPKTEAGVKWLQKKLGAGADGEWGQQTEKLFAAFRK
jgi:CHAP domain-containing protein/putative peptidoglycan binding protein